MSGNVILLVFCSRVRQQFISLFLCFRRSFQGCFANITWIPIQGTIGILVLIHKVKIASSSQIEHMFDKLRWSNKLTIPLYTLTSLGDSFKFCLSKSTARLQLQVSSKPVYRLHRLEVLISSSTLPVIYTTSTRSVEHGCWLSFSLLY